ncbi:MAG: response regulator [Pseudomonadota bacterium]
MTSVSEIRINKILLIDDSRIEQLMYRRIIDRAGIVDEVVAFSYAEDALNHLANARDDWPNIILLDINMPRMDGFEFIAAMEDRLGTQGLPIVMMLTTSLDPSDEVRASQTPLITDFLVKPLTEDDLIGMANMLLDRRSTAGA